MDGSQLSPFHQDCPFSIFHDLCFDTENNSHDDVTRDGGRDRVRGDLEKEKEKSRRQLSSTSRSIIQNAPRVG